MSCCFNHGSLTQDTYLHGKGRGFNHKDGYMVGNLGIYSVTIFIPLERHVSSRMSTTSVAMQLLIASHYLRYRTALSLKSSDTHKAVLWRRLRRILWVTSVCIDASDLADIE